MVMLWLVGHLLKDVQGLWRSRTIPIHPSLGNLSEQFLRNKYTYTLLPIWCWVK